MAENLRPSSVRKRRSVLDAAEIVFLRDGYLGANMDELADRSGVSKQTVYAHFGSKEGLFLALVADLTTRTGDVIGVAAMPVPAKQSDVPSALCDVAERQLTYVLRPHVLQLRRLVIGEVTRFPDLARVLWERGPDRAVDGFEIWFRRLTASGVLPIDAPRRAASAFNWLVMSEPLNRAMLLGDDAVPGAAELHAHCTEAVRVFLAGYASTTQAGSGKSEPSSDETGNNP